MANKFIQNSIFSAFMMTNLINDLLDLGKLQNSAFELFMERYNLISIIEKAFGILSFQAANKSIRLFLSMDMLKPMLLQNMLIDKRRLL